MNNTKGFSLIELMAVIIVIAVISTVAVISVSGYLVESKKRAYIDVARSLISSIKNNVNSNKYGIDSFDTIYYIPASYVVTENETSSPYGDFTVAYIGVVFSDDSYKYYWISNDETGQGVRNVTEYNDLKISTIETNITDQEIIDNIKTTKIKERKIVKIMNADGSWNEPIEITD